MRGAAGLVGALGVCCGTIGWHRRAPEHRPIRCQSDSYDSLNCFDLVDELEQVDGALT